MCIYVLMHMHTCICCTATAGAQLCSLVLQGDEAGGASVLVHADRDRLLPSSST